MTGAERSELAAMLAATERRLTTMVNERTTNVINATSAIVSALQIELHTTSQALETYSAHTITADRALEARVTRLEAIAGDDRLVDAADLLTRFDAIESALVSAHPLERWMRRHTLAIILVFELAQWLMLVVLWSVARGAG